MLSEKDVKHLFRESFKFEPASVTEPMRAPPVATHYSLVGTAFDYLVRFWLERNYEVSEQHRWIAEESAMYLSANCGVYARPTPANVALSFVESAKEEAAAYVKSGEPSDHLLQSVLMLASLDQVFRSGRLGHFQSMAYSTDMNDLRGLLKVLEDSDLRNITGPVWLNPTFGRASEMVGGADADFIAGDMLVDIKVTKTTRFTREHFNQLAGYCVLDHLGDMRGELKKPKGARLSKAGIYFARHGVLKTVDTGAIYEAPGFERFVSAFRKMAEKRWGAVAATPAAAE